MKNLIYLKLIYNYGERLNMGKLIYHRSTKKPIQDRVEYLISLQYLKLDSLKVGGIGGQDWGSSVRD